MSQNNESRPDPSGPQPGPSLEDRVAEEQGKLAAICGEVQVAVNSTSPRTMSASAKAWRLKAGDRVRVISERHHGRIGVVLNIADLRVPGIVAWRVARPVDVRFDDGPLGDWELFAPGDLAPEPSAQREGGQTP